jgi:hypothetical protein
MCLPNINDLKSLSLNMARLKPSFPYMQSAFLESACLPRSQAPAWECVEE